MAAEDAGASGPDASAVAPSCPSEAGPKGTADEKVTISEFIDGLEASEAAKMSHEDQNALQQCA